MTLDVSKGVMSEINVVFSNSRYAEKIIKPDFLPRNGTSHSFPIEVFHTSDQFFQLPPYTIFDFSSLETLDS